jgi:uncharacterized protein
MELEKTLTLPAPPEAVWALLLDPRVMAECVPGTKAVEVLSPTQYRCEIHVRIAFISAKFKIRTQIVEQRAPLYLKTEGIGEDSAAASSFKQTSEIELASHADGQTLLHLKLRVDLLGRLGSFGMNVMKTKADRMWDEFGDNLAKRLTPGTQAEPSAVAASASAGASLPGLAIQPASLGLPAGLCAQVLPSPAAARRLRWWQRLFAPTPVLGEIHVTVQRGDLRLEVRWPVQGADACAAWLRELSASPPDVARPPDMPNTAVMAKL